MPVRDCDERLDSTFDALRLRCHTMSSPPREFQALAWLLSHPHLMTTFDVSTLFTMASGLPSSLLKQLSDLPSTRTMSPSLQCSFDVQILTQTDRDSCLVYSTSNRLVIIRSEAALKQGLKSEEHD